MMQLSLQVMSGAATCFYAYVGFDIIATSGEEANQPTRSIPTAIFITLFICFLAYFGVSTVLTLIVPFDELSGTAALAKAFTQRGVTGAEIVIAIGALCGLSASMVGGMFALPRIIYSMATDGLILRFLGWVNSCTSTPMVATWVGGILTAIVSMLFDLESLVEMMSIGTLMAYSLCAISILTLRYQKESVGLSACDEYEDITFNAPDSQKVEPRRESRESTGLIQIGDNVNTIKYVQKKEKTVFKRVSSKRDDDSDQEEAQEVESSLESTKDSQENAKLNRDKQILKRMAHIMSEPQTPPDSTYHRVDSNYSLSSIGQIFNFGEDFAAEPTSNSRNLALGSLIGVILLWIGVSVVCMFYGDVLLEATWWLILVLALLFVCIIVLFVIICRQPQNRTKLNFRVPLVPLIPILSIMINLYLMISLSPATWIRFAIWTALGE